MRKVFIKISIVLVVALFCFVTASRLIEYTTSPKAMFINLGSIRYGSEVEFMTTLEDLDNTDIYWEDAISVPVTIIKVLINPNKLIEEGDDLFVCIPNPEFYDTEKQALDEKLDELLEQKIEIIEIIARQRIKLDSDEVVFVQSYIEKSKEATLIKAQLLNKLSDDISTEDYTDNDIFVEYLNTLDDSLGNQFIVLDEELQSIETDMIKELKVGSNKDYKVAIRYYTLLDDIQETSKRLEKIKVLEETQITCKASVDGRIRYVYYKPGDVYNGSSPLYSISPNTMPYLTVMKSALPAMFDNSLVFEARYNGELFACKYIGYTEDKLLFLPHHYMFKYKNIMRLLGSQFTMRAGVDIGSGGMGASSARDTLPIECLVEIDGRTYIYIAEMVQGLWEEEYIVKSVRVSVKQKNDRYVTIASDEVDEDTIVLSKWDRNIKNGDRVFKYAD